MKILALRNKSTIKKFWLLLNNVLIPISLKFNSKNLPDYQCCYLYSWQPISAFCCIITLNVTIVGMRYMNKTTYVRQRENCHLFFKESLWVRKTVATSTHWKCFHMPCFAIPSFCPDIIQLYKTATWSIWCSTQVKKMGLYHGQNPWTYLLA